MKKILIAIGIAVTVAACNNDNSSVEKESTNDTLQEAVEDEKTVQAQQSFPELFAYLSAQDATFKPDSFALYGENEVAGTPAAPVDTAALQPFKKYFIYNSDSTKAIDLYSYNYIITQRSGTPKMEAAGPDTEVGLVDEKTKTRRRIFFSGPATTVYDARWVNNNEVMLAGAEVQEDGSGIKPTIWQVNLLDSTMQVYNYGSTVKADMNGYQKEKLAKGN